MLVVSAVFYRKGKPPCNDHLVSLRNATKTMIEPFLLNEIVRLKLAVEERDLNI